MNKTIISILMAIIGLSFISCDNQKSHNKFDSSFHEKPLNKHNQKLDSRKYLIPGLDHGLLQSPINILSKQTETGRHNITVNFKDEINKVDNLGHTVQLDFEEGHK